jgi:hypothetical protein
VISKATASLAFLVFFIRDKNAYLLPSDAVLKENILQYFRAVLAASTFQ